MFVIIRLIVDYSTILLFKRKIMLKNLNILHCLDTKLFSSMKIDDDLLTCIVDDLLIPKQSIKVKSVQEAIAIVDDDWVFNLTQNCSVVASNISKNISNFELSTELHHGANDLNGYSKVYICCNKSLWLNEALTTSTANTPHCFGKFYETLAKQCFYEDWKSIFLTFPDCYNEENFETENHSQIFDDCNLNVLKNACIFENNSKDSNKLYSVSSINTWNHVNLLPNLAIVQFSKRVYIIKKCILHCVYDSLMYSPYMLSTSNAKPLFLIFQLIKLMHYLSTVPSQIQIYHLTWKKISLDHLLWIQADINFCHNPLMTNSYETKENKTVQNLASEKTKTLQKYLDLWVCFIYLFFLFIFYSI